MNLENVHISYIIISSEKLDDIISVLYGKEYSIIEMKSITNGIHNESILAYGCDDNNILRDDVLFILDKFKKDNAIIKYKGEKNPKKVFTDGSEVQLCISLFNIEENTSYIHKGLSFSFIEQQRYWIPSKKEDFRAGMVIEYLNNNKWCEKVVTDPSSEWDKMYKLLLKYNKIRIPSKKKLPQGI